MSPPPPPSVDAAHQALDALLNTELPGLVSRMLSSCEERIEQQHEALTDVQGKMAAVVQPAKRVAREAAKSIVDWVTALEAWSLLPSAKLSVETLVTKARNAAVASAASKSQPAADQERAGEEAAQRTRKEAEARQAWARPHSIAWKQAADRCVAGAQDLAARAAADTPAK